MFVSRVSNCPVNEKLRGERETGSNNIDLFEWLCKDFLRAIWRDAPPCESKLCKRKQILME